MPELDLPRFTEMPTVHNKVEYKKPEKDNRPLWVNPLDLNNKVFTPNSLPYNPNMPINPENRALSVGTIDDIYKMDSTTKKKLPLSKLVLPKDRVNDLYNITGKEDKTTNRILLPVYLPDRLDLNYKMENRPQNYRLYEIQFGHTKLTISETILTIAAAVDNGLIYSDDDKERMIKALNMILQYPEIFNNLNHDQLKIITSAIMYINLPSNYIEAELPRFISLSYYKEFTSSINIFLLNTITLKPLILKKNDGTKIKLFLTDILPLLKKGYEIDLGEESYTVLDNQIALHRDIELGLKVSGIQDVLEENELREELLYILD